MLCGGLALEQLIFLGQAVAGSARPDLFASAVGGGLRPPQTFPSASFMGRIDFFSAVLRYTATKKNTGTKYLHVRTRASNERQR